MLLRSFNAFLALLAASRASAASTTFLRMVCATFGVSSKNFARCSDTTPATMPSTSRLFSRFFSCESNCGSGTWTLMTTVSPSRKSSPIGETFLNSSSLVP